MKTLVSALRLKRFEADEKARKVADLERMVLEFENIAADLDRQIRAEEDRTRVKDPAHFAYSTFAKSARQRRDNLRTSADGLKAKLEAAKRERDEALEQFNGADTPAAREELRDCGCVAQVTAALRDINDQRQNPQWMRSQDQRPRRIASSGSMS